MPALPREAAWAEERLLGLCISCRASKPKWQKTLICTESVVSADSRKSAKKCGKVWKTAPFCVKCAKSAGRRAFWHSFWKIGGNPTFFVQINVFAVWALRLDGKYTILGDLWQSVPQNGLVHLLGLDLGPLEYGLTRTLKTFSALTN